MCMCKYVVMHSPKALRFAAPREAERALDAKSDLRMESNPA